MDLPEELSSADFDIKAWLNASIPESEPEAYVGDLYTKLQLESHETATALENAIAQALSRLPRAAMEIERMSTEAAGLSQQVTKVVVDAAPATEAIPEKLQQLESLHEAKGKLKHCSSVLSEASALAGRVDAMERTIGSFAQRGASDVDIDATANEIGSIQSTLNTLHKIDKAYGEALQLRVNRLESKLQESLERECVEMLKKQDSTRAPKLLSTLRTIGRDKDVVDMYIKSLTDPKLQRLSEDLRRDDGGSIVSALKSHYRSVLKLCDRERTYWQNAIGSEQCEEVIGTLVKLLLIEPSIVGEKLMSLSNSNLAEAWGAVTQVKELGAAAIVGASLPFKRAAPSFVDRERESLKTTASHCKGMEDFGLIVEAIDASTKRFATFTLATSTSAVEVCNDCIQVFVGDTQSSLEQLIRNQTDASTLVLMMNSCKALPQRLSVCEARVKSRFPDHEGGILNASKEAVDVLVRGFEKKVQGVFIKPVIEKVSSYSTSSVWAPGGRSGPAGMQVAPSELIHSVAEELMELPLKLESTNVEQDDVQSWVNAAVDQFVQEYSAQIKEVTVTAMKDTEQIMSDLEYVQNVLSALCETHFEMLFDLGSKVQQGAVAHFSNGGKEGVRVSDII